MRTLADVFAPGSPALPEALRTLAVSPEREVEPGMTIRATFTFRNLGGAPATGVRVRFNLPEGLVYLVGSGMLDGVGLDDETGASPLLSHAGALIGDVAPGEERRLEIAYSVAGAVENGSTIELQAAVASFEVPPVGSNVVRLIARSKPHLDNARTVLDFESLQAVRPGAETTLVLRVHNDGESSAHDVVAEMQLPEHARYVPGSVRVNGRRLEADAHVPFDRLRAPVIVPVLAAGATATLSLRMRVDDVVPVGAALRARALVASQEVAAFERRSSDLSVTAGPRFDDNRSSLSIEPGPEVRPGARLTLRLQVTNAGEADAENAVVRFAVPEGLEPVRGTAAVDGQPVRERKRDAALEIGRIPAGATAEVRWDCVVAAPLPDGMELLVRAVLTWEPAASDGPRERLFQRTVIVRSAPFFSPRRSRLERTSPSCVRPGDEIAARIDLVNDGPAAATDAVVRLQWRPVPDDLRIVEGTIAHAPVPSGDGTVADAVELGTIEASSARALTVRARVPLPFPDRGEIVLGAALHTQELGETSLGEVRWEVASRPHFTAERTRCALIGDEALRPGRLAELVVTAANEGTETARDVRVRLYVSPEARIESVDGGGRQGSAIVLGEIAPGGSAHARVGLRLLRGVAQDHPVTVDGVLTAEQMLPLPLERLVIATTAAPDFADGVLRSDPAETVQAGERVAWVLHVRNGGDGTARRVVVRVADSDALVYVPGSTSVNGIPLRDVGAVAPLASERGIVLTDLDPGVEAVVRWYDVAHNGLPSGTEIRRTATIEYDGGRRDEIVARPLRVRAAPLFAGAVVALPFGVEAVLVPGDLPEAISGERFVQLPPAVPVGSDAIDVEHVDVSAVTAVSDGRSGRLALDEGDRSSREVVEFASLFSRRRLEHALLLLDEARFEGLAGHLFTLRAFFPDCAGALQDGPLAAMRESVREILERLFIKLRLPGYEITPRDVDLPGMRPLMERLLADARAYEPVALEREDGTILVRGTAACANLRAAMQRAEAGGAAAWALAARLLPGDTPQAAAYRDRLVTTLDHLADGGSFHTALRREAAPVLTDALTAWRAVLHAERVP